MSVSYRLIKEVRSYLRIATDDFDGEIVDLIESAIADLAQGGISSSEDALYKRAVVTYVKAEFGLENTDAERYREAYQNIKKHLMLTLSLPI